MATREKQSSLSVTANIDARSWAETNLKKRRWLPQSRLAQARELRYIMLHIGSEHRARVKCAAAPIGGINHAHAGRNIS